MSADRPLRDEPEAQRDWRDSLRCAVRDARELAGLLGLEEPPPGLTGAAENAFPLLVPREFVARMRRNDPDDPLLRQVLPAPEESRPAGNFVPDPLEEHGLAANGCIRKYPGRALLITTAACPVHCRYCFRREFPYADQTAAREDWQRALAAIAAGPPVSEVILSGGDPLSLGNSNLTRLVRGIEALPSATTLRVHTRFPVVLPSRVDDGLIGLLSATCLRIVVVLHANHPAEIDDAVASAVERLKRVTRLVLNQSVLLRGVNDDVETLIALSDKLLEAGVAPYYLHVLDRVTGTAHFEVGETQAADLIDAMRKRVPGYFVPRLVRDEPGELSKTILV